MEEKVLKYYIKSNLMFNLSFKSIFKVIQLQPFTDIIF